jgi:DNA-binding response OmpR family regulator
MHRGDKRPLSTSPPPQPSRERRDVLVVEDDDAVRTSMAAVLAQNGYTVAEAADVRQALHLLSTVSVEVLVLDRVMPQTDGLLMLDMLERPPRVLMVSAHPLDDEARLRGSKIEMYLQKPVQPAELIHVVGKLIGRSP